MSEIDTWIRIETVLNDYDRFKATINQNERNSDAVLAGIGAGASEAVRQAVAENEVHFQYYRDMDPTHLNGRSNTKHGTAAERRVVHDWNIENIKNDKNADAQLSDSKIDPQVDITKGNLNYQSKFCRTPRATFNSLMEGNYENVCKLVPGDQYSDILRIAAEESKNYAAQAEICRAQGDTVNAERYQFLAEKADNIAKTSEPASISYAESQNLIANRVRDTVLSTAKSCHEAGVEAAQIGAIIGAVMSGFENIVAVEHGDKDIQSAVLDTIVGAASSAGKAYGIGFSSSLVATGFQAASKATAGIASDVFNTMSQGCIPTMIVVGTVEFTKTIYKYAKGQITAREMGIELGEKSVGLTASTVLGGAAASIGGPVAGVVVSLVAYSVSTAIYNGVIETMQLVKNANEIARLTQLYTEAYDNLCKTRAELEKYLQQQTMRRNETVVQSFRQMELCIYNNDLTSFNLNLQRVLKIFSSDLVAKDLEEFDAIVKSPIPLTI